MMGRTHALVGALVAEGVVTHFTGSGWIECGTAGVVITAASLLPDIDHSHGTIARSYGPITWAVCKLTGKLSGGHRHATHSLLGAAVFAGMAQVGLAYRHTWAGLLLALPLILTLAGLVRLLGIPGILDDLLPIPVVLFGVFISHMSMWFVPGAIGIGCLAHLLADCATTQGCPLLWPVQTHFRYGWMTTNHAMERWVVTPAACAGIVVLPMLEIYGRHKS